jgi:hypothetical protein
MDEDLQLEMEQLDYIRRNAQDFNIPDDTVQYPDALKQPLDRPIVLSQEQEKKIIEEIRRQIPSKKTMNTSRRTFSILEIISSSFLGIMEDLLNFDGDIESLKDILTKEDRTVFMAIVVISVAVIVILNKKY